jgi:hypothetical protein
VYFSVDSWERLEREINKWFGVIMMSKPLLCRLGIHKIDKEGFVKVYRRRSDRHGGKYSSNYAICKRCGCLCYRLRFFKRRRMM